MDKIELNFNFKVSNTKMEPLIISGYQQIRRRYLKDKVVTYYHHLVDGLTSWQVPEELRGKFEEEEGRRRKEVEKAQEGTRDRARVCEACPDSDWRIVYTHGGARFFYNPVLHHSTWEIPEELKSQLDPEATKKQKDSKGQEPSPETPQQVTGTEMTEEDVAHQLAAMGIDMDYQSGPMEQDPHDVYEYLPSEDRSRQFKELLKDVGTTALDLWENIVPKIMNDPRYKLIPSVKDQKQLFDQYCKDYVKLPSSVKPVPIKIDTKDEYRQLVEAFATTKSTWTKFNKQYFSDPRSQAVPYREREQIFVDYLEALKESKRREKEERKERRARNEAAFKECLDELSLHRDSSWRKTRRLIEDDDRYIALKHDDVREDIFRDYVRHIGDRRRSSRREPRSRSKSAAPSSGDEQDKKRRRQEESLLQRERQVRQELKSREQHTKKQLNHLERQNATDLFKALVADLIRQHNIPYPKAMEVIEQDSRFSQIHLDPETMRQLYEEHTDHILRQREEAFRNLVSSQCPLDADSPPPGLLTDPIAQQLGNEDDLQGRFRRLQTSRIEQAKEDLRQLLDENQYLSFKARAHSSAPTEEGAEPGHLPLDEAALQDLEGTLSNDSRYTCLSFLPEIRRHIIQEKFQQRIDQERLQVPEFLTQSSI